MEGARYEVHIDDLTGKKTNLIPNLVVTGTSWELTIDLISGRTYGEQVRAINAAGAGGWGPLRGFVIGRPTLTGPATGVMSLQPTLSWNAFEGASGYEVLLHDITGKRPNLFRATVTGLSWAPPADLVSGGTYVWQLRALNNVGQGYWAAAGKFAVGTPVLAGPAGDAPDKTPDFGWSAVTGAATYQPDRRPDDGQETGGSGDSRREDLDGTDRPGPRAHLPVVCACPEHHRARLLQSGPPFPGGCPDHFPVCPGFFGRAEGPRRTVDERV